MFCKTWEMNRRHTACNYFSLLDGVNRTPSTCLGHTKKCVCISCIAKITVGGVVVHKDPPLKAIHFSQRAEHGPDVKCFATCTIIVHCCHAMRDDVCIDCYSLWSVVFTCTITGTSCNMYMYLYLHCICSTLYLPQH